jgi:hypothetical protein
MIGAKDVPDAMREAFRSSGYCKRETLQVWDAATAKYVNV